MKSSAQLTRLLRLVPYLVAHQGVTTRAAAEAFGVTPQQIIRDIEVLQFCGLPGGYYDDLFDVDIDVVRTEGVIYFNNADVLARPLRLRPAEAASLLAALQLVVEVTGSSAAASSALGKLAAAVGGQGQLSVAVTDAGDPGHRAELSRAIEERRAVRLGYYTAGRAGLTTAVVEPARLRLVDGFTYLEGWSRLREGWRSFRLDRIDSVAVLEEGCRERGEPPSGWFDDAPASATLTLAPRARWVTEYFPTSAVTQVEGGWDVTFPVASRDWLASLVLRLGRDVLAVSDPEVAALARTRARQALELYEPN